MADLKTDYKNDILDTDINETRKYEMIQNQDSTVSFRDVTAYLQDGDPFGGNDINATNTRVNELNADLTANSNHFYFDYHDGKYGFNTSENRGADTFTPFSSGIKYVLILLRQTDLGNYYPWIYGTLDDVDTMSLTYIRKNARDVVPVINNEWLKTTTGSTQILTKKECYMLKGDGTKVKYNANQTFVPNDQSVIVWFE